MPLAELFHPATFSPALAAVAVGGNVHAETLVLSSSDNSLVITLSADDGQARYSVSHRGETLLKPSPLGLLLDKGGMLSRGLTITGSRQTVFSFRWPGQLTMNGTRIPPSYTLCL